MLLGSSFWSRYWFNLSYIGDACLCYLASRVLSWEFEPSSHVVCNLFKDQVVILFLHEFIYIDVKGKLMIQVGERLLLNAIFLLVFDVLSLPPHWFSVNSSSL